MKKIKFRDGLELINVTVGMCLFGFAIPEMLLGEYKSAATLLFIVSILFVVGYFTERIARIN